MSPSISFHLPEPALDRPNRARGRALVVEDEGTARLLLEGYLLREQYTVWSAIDAAEAIEKFEAHQPDIVFLDVILPDRSGYEVARLIKARTGEHFVPIIFLTSLSEDEALEPCIAAGGDDFLTKPFSFHSLRAKVEAIERIRDLYEGARAQRAELAVLHARMQYEQDIAERILSGAVMSRNVAQPPVRTLLRSATTFNGDMFISARTPSGGLMLMLGDFTGHGLASALGALPVAETFRSMVATGFSLAAILDELNSKLYRLLPRGMFLAAAALHLEAGQGVVQVWNSGLPALALSRAGGRVQRFLSAHPPLGMLPELLDESLPTGVRCAAGDAFLLCSDGLVEAANAGGEVFGEARLDALLRAQAPLRLFEALEAELQGFLGDTPLVDDVSVVWVPVGEALFRAEQDPVSEHPGSPCVDWDWALELGAGSLARVDPVPLVMAQLRASGVAERHRQRLFMIVSELYAHALNQGVLGLDACAAGGDLEWLAARDAALAALERGRVRLELEGRADCLFVRISDSGPGYLQTELAAGPGLTRTVQLCRALRHLDGSASLEAEYAFA